MKKSRIMMSMFVIALAAALIGGATMSFFWFKVEVEENVFTAGTVEISAVELRIEGGDAGNVNPGDCLDKVIQICNEGTKDAKVRIAAAVKGEVEYDWERIRDEADGLCYSGEVDPEWTEDDVLDWIEDYLETEGIELDDIVTITVDDDNWEEGADGWYVYNGVLEADGECITVDVTVCFDGPNMINIFQGASISVTVKVEAIQASHEAAEASGWYLP